MRKKLTRLTVVVLAALALLVGVFAIYGFTQPSEWHVDRRITVNAAPELVHRDVADLRQWPEWTAWTRELDPAARWTFTGPESAVGMTMVWDGPELDVGKVVLTEVTAGRGIRYDLFFGDGSNPGRGHIEITPRGTGCDVRWRDVGSVGGNPFMRAFVPTLQGMLDKDFDEGLRKLKARAEHGH